MLEDGRKSQHQSIAQIERGRRYHECEIDSKLNVSPQTVNIFKPSDPIPIVPCHALIMKLVSSFSGFEIGGRSFRTLPKVRSGSFPHLTC